MNLKSKVAALAVLGTVGMSALAGAVSVGVVNVNEVLNNYPGFGAVVMQEQKIQQEYGPQIQKEMEKINGMKDKAAQEKAFQEKVVPLDKKATEAINKVMAPVMEKVGKSVEAVRAEKGLDIVLTMPQAVAAVAPNSSIVDITNEVVQKVK